MTIDLDLVQTSKPEKVAANTFQAYQASVSDAWDIEVSLGWEEVVEEAAGTNFESRILSTVLLPNPLDGGVTTEMID